VPVTFSALTCRRYWFTAHTDDNLSPGAPTLVRVGLALRY